jgi:hypothetical protein
LGRRKGLRPDRDRGEPLAREDGGLEAMRGF